MNNTIIHLTDANFKYRVLECENKESVLFLVDFWAEWCNPCKAMSSVLEDISLEFVNTLQVAKLNIDESPVITKNYGIKSIPTLLLIRNGTVLSTKVGLLSKQQLQEFIKMHI